MKIAVIVGSLREESINLKAAKALMSLGPKSMEFLEIKIGDLPLYNEDFDRGTPPRPWTVFRDQVSACDGVLFVTPEYNRSVPGVLKNAIDVGSRPYGKSVWKEKPAAIMSVSPGPIGGFGANHHLRQSLVFLDMPAMQQPEAYIGSAAELFSREGKILNESTEKYLKKFIDAFAVWVEKLESV